MKYHLGGKRVFDLVLAVLAIVALLPVFLVLCLLVLVLLGRPVMFRQIRSGLYGRPFALLKFRTMHDGSGSDAERMTRMGYALRVYGLDELPQLFNVLRGEMSFVGPRPLPVHYPMPEIRNSVRPGITGPVQTGGRNALPWARRFQMDVAYARTPGLRADVMYLLRTPGVLLRRDGACTPGCATALPPEEMN